MKSRRNFRWSDVRKNNIELKDLVNYYETFNRSEGKSPKTVKWYREVLDRFVGWLELQEKSTKLGSIDQIDVIEFILWLREKRFNGFITSRDIDRIRDGAMVKAAGLVIRRQRPHGKVVFLTLEDEFGHIPCMVFGKVYNQYEHFFRSSFLIIKGTLTWREGTCNVVIQQVKPFRALDKVPEPKDWR